MPSLRDFGIDTSESQLPFFKPKGRPQRIRIIEPQAKPTDSKIPTLARFLIETEDGEKMLWDVTGNRLLAQLGALDDVGAWFEVSRTGKDFDTRYTVTPSPPEESKAEPSRGTSPTSGSSEAPSCHRCGRTRPPVYPTDEHGPTCGDCVAALAAPSTADGAASAEAPETAETSPSPSSS